MLQAQRYLSIVEINVCHEAFEAAEVDGWQCRHRASHGFLRIWRCHIFIV